MLSAAGYYRLQDTIGCRILSADTRATVVQNHLQIISIIGGPHIVLGSNTHIDHVHVNILGFYFQLYCLNSSVLGFEKQDYIEWELLHSILIW